MDFREFLLKYISFSIFLLHFIYLEAIAGVVKEDELKKAANTAYATASQFWKPRRKAKAKQKAVVRTKQERKESGKRGKRVSWDPWRKKKEERERKSFPWTRKETVRGLKRKRESKRVREKEGGKERRKSVAVSHVRSSDGDVLSVRITKRAGVLPTNPDTAPHYRALLHHPSSVAISSSLLPFLPPSLSFYFFNSTLAA